MNKILVILLIFALVTVIQLVPLSQAAITPSLTASRCTTPGETCVAPLAVHFSARGTECTTEECDNNTMENEAFHSLHYKWEFGDDKGDSWDVSGQDKNIEYGPLAIHVFDEEGTYDVQLTINSESESVTEIVTIYVDDPDTYYSSNTRCISTDDDFTDCPLDCTVATCVTSSDFDASFLTALSEGSRRILYHAGHTFNMDATSTVTTEGPVTLGSFGTDNEGKAIIDATGCACNLLSIGWQVQGQLDDWRIMDLEILQVHSGAMDLATLFNTDGGRAFDNILVYRLKRLVGDRFWGQMRTSAYFPEGSFGIFMVENEIGGNFGNTIYLATRQGGIIGNVVGTDSSPYPNHMLRFGSPGRWEDALIAHNDWKCCGRLDLTHRGESGDSSQGTYDVDPCQFLVLRENKYHAGVSGWGIGIHPQNGASDERIRDVIVENNLFESNWLHIQARSITIRNNLFTSDPNLENDYVTTDIDVAWDHACAIPSDWITDIFIYHNSHYSTPDVINTPVVYHNRHCGAPDRPIENIYIRNNVNYGGSNVPYIDINSFPPASNVVESDNIGNNALSSSPYAADPPDIFTPSDWYLEGGSASLTVNQGYPVGNTVYEDYEHNVRSDGSWDIGAFELQAAQTCSDAGDCTVVECRTASCPSGECEYSADDTQTCGDDEYCNGVNSCSGGSCVATDPCPDQMCDEGNDVCVDCLSSGDCDDGVVCNGQETCLDGLCQAGTPITSCDPNASDNCCPNTCTPASDLDCSNCEIEDLDEWVNTPIAAQTDTFIVEFEATPNSSSMDGIVGLADYPASNWDNSSVTIRFNGDGGIDAWNNTEIYPWSGDPTGWYSSVDTISYFADTLYHFRFEIDVSNQIFNAYVTPDGGAEQTIVIDNDFRDTTTPVVQLDYWHSMYSRFGVGAFRVCNFEVIGSQCISPAEIEPCDGCVSFNEVTSYIDTWYADSSAVSMVQLVRALEAWKVGGC